VALRTRAATLRVARIAVLGAILLRGAVCAEERDRGSHAEREAALARCLSAEGASPGSIWTAFLDAAPVFSTSEGADCHFTSFTLAPIDNNPGRRPMLQRTMLEATAEHRLGLTTLEDYVPMLMVYDQHQIVRQDPPPWLTQAGGKWAFVIDRDHLLNHSDPKHPLAGPRGQIQVDLGSFVGALLRGETPAPKSARFGRGVRFESSKGDQIWIAFRTPNDAARFGTCVGSVLARSHRDIWVAVQALIIGRDSDVRFRLPEPERLVDRIGARRHQPGDPQVVQLQNLTSAEGRKPGELIWSELRNVSLDPPDAESPFLREVIAHGATLVLEKLEASSAGSEESEFTWKDCDVLTAALSQARAAQALVGVDELPLVDDPHLIWHAFELGLGPVEASELYREYALKVLASEHIPIDVKAVFCDVLGDLGPAPGITQTLGSTKAALAVVLASRWEWEVGDAGARICEHELTFTLPGSPREHVFVETLLRLNQLPRVPARQLERWYQREVVNGSAEQRLEALRVLTLQPTGQAWLIERLEREADVNQAGDVNGPGNGDVGSERDVNDRADDRGSDDASRRVDGKGNANEAVAEPRRTALAVLRLRAEATLAQQRWDFMSEPLCRRAMALADASRPKP